MKLKKTNGIILINLGTPDSLTLIAIKKYLKNFLINGKVFKGPEWIIRILVNIFIIPFRSKNLLKSYLNIQINNKSPLMIFSKKICQYLKYNISKKQLNYTTKLSMLYGNPNIKLNIYS